LDPLPLERAALRAWPALETVDEGGWVLRFSGGFTQRSNSATVLTGGPPELLAARVEACERAFRARGLPPLFRVVSFAGAAELEALLVARGYRRRDESLVMTLPLARRPAGGPEVRALALEDWLLAYERASGKDGAGRPLHRALLEAIPGRRLLAALDAGGTPATVGLAVIEGAWAGLFDVATVPALRRHGLGRRLVEGMLSWASGAGAAAAYLQVLAANAPAVRLYAGLGFEEGYRYWYWLLDPGA
jgi:GNAT superfamily N-acetyltransferase